MLASAASSFSENRFRALVLNLFSSVNAVKQNSFLSCQSICPSPERIYVDPATCGIRLVYLPLDRRLFASEAIFEMKLRTGLAGLMAGIPTAASPKWKEFAQALADEKLSWA